jgi:iron complex outermembrane receptor protein
MRKRGIVLAITAMAAGGGFGAPAAAQDSAPAGAPPGQAQGGGQPSSGGIETVVVTARRTAEDSQTVPVAVSAFNADDLQREQINTAQDLQGRVPSMTIGSNSQLRNTETPTIRGQGGTYGASPGVVVYFAEVPMAQDAVTNTQGGPGKFFDLANVQILKGSQGTLFGRNTTGGAMLIEPHKPENQFGFALRDSGSSLSGQTVESILNVPIVSGTLLLRAGFQFVSRGGFTHDVVTGEDYDNKHYWTGRIGLTWRPTDTIENYLLGYYTLSKDNGSGYVIEGINRDGLNYGLLAEVLPTLNSIPYPTAQALANTANVGCIYLNLLGPSTNCGQDIVDAQKARGPRHVALSGPPDDHIKTGGATDQFRWELSDNLTLRNIASYSFFVHQFRWDLSGSSANFDTEVNPDDANSGDVGLFTEELQLQGSAFGSRLKYVAGAFYSMQKPQGTQQEDPIALFMSIPAEVYGVTSRSYAPYAQGTYDLGDIWELLDGYRLTLGVRDTFDHITGFSNAGNGPHTGDFRKAVLTYTAGLDKQLGATLLYGKYSRGYKAGGFQPIAVNPVDYTFKPEFVRNYEIGQKSDFNIGKMPARWNTAVYYTNYSDMQRAAEDSLPNASSLSAGFGAAIYTAGKAEVAGVESDFTVQPFSGMTATLNYALTYGNYKQFTLQNNAINPQLDCSNTYVEHGSSADLSCVPFQYTPRNQASMSLRYQMPQDVAGGKLQGSMTYAWIDKQYASSYQRPEAEPGAWLSPYGLLNANLTWETMIGDKSAFDIQLFGTNLTDKTYRISNSNVWNSIYFRSSLYGEPRIFGLQLGFGWGM